MTEVTETLDRGMELINVPPWSSYFVYLGASKNSGALRQHHFRLQTTCHLPGQSTGVRTAREASASHSAGATLILGSGQSAGQSNTASGKNPVLGLHLRPGGGPNTR